MTTINKHLTFWHFFLTFGLWRLVIIDPAFTPACMCFFPREYLENVQSLSLENALKSASCSSLLCLHWERWSPVGSLCNISRHFWSSEARLKISFSASTCKFCQVNWYDMELRGSLTVEFKRWSSLCTVLHDIRELWSLTAMTTATPIYILPRMS